MQNVTDYTLYKKFSHLDNLSSSVAVGYFHNTACFHRLFRLLIFNYGVGTKLKRNKFITYNIFFLVIYRIFLGRSVYLLSLKLLHNQKKQQIFLYPLLQFRLLYFLVKIFTPTFDIEPFFY